MKLHYNLPLAAIALLAVTLSSVDAALPLTAIAEMQEAAPEKIRIEITSVKRTEKKTGRHFEIEFQAKAKVVAVDRTGSDLKADDEIDVSYTVPNLEKQPTAGDWPGPVSEGSTYTAYLSHAGDAGEKSYQPAASSGSFQSADRGE